MNFFKGIKKVLDQYGILLVVDEVQMGFYRTGKLWSIEHFGVTPDILVFAKSLTNGLNPLGGLWAREELINPTIFPPGQPIPPLRPTRWVQHWVWKSCRC